MSNKQFKCEVCNFSSNYDFKGQQPPFAKDITVMEDAYIMKDPFTEEKRCILLGADCSSCNCQVCISQDCSMFYTKRFCLPCVKDNQTEFPEEIKQEITKKHHNS